MAVGVSNFPTSLDTAVELIQPANNAITELDGSLTNSATTIVVDSTASFSTTGMIAIGDELVTYTGKTSTSFTGCTRGYDGTTASAHASGTSVEDVIARAHHNVLSSAIISMQAKLGSGSSTPTANTVLKGIGAGSSSYGQIVNSDIDPSAAIAYSKVNLSNAIVNNDISTSAAIAYSKLALSGSIVNADIATGAAIAYSKLAMSGSIVNADIASGAAIAYSKLALSGSIVNADVSTGAAIAYSKLAMSGSIVNADIASGAAIAYSKLNLSNSIVNADIASGAAIAYSKLAALTADRLLVSSAAGAVSASTLTWNATDSAVGAVKAVDFTGVTTAVTPLRLQFNTDLLTAELGLNTNVSLPIGQVEMVQVKRSTNGGLAKGKVVYVVGSDGANKTVDYAIATSGITGDTTLGVMAETVSGSGKAFCITSGFVSGISTTGLTEGQPVYLSHTSAGDLVSTAPSAPNHRIQVGYCVREHANQGVIFVSIRTAYELWELCDVSAPNPVAAGSTLIRNATTGVWTAATLTAGSGIVVTNADGAITVATTGSGGATNIWIPASAWIPRTTTGPGVDSRETSTHRVNTDELLFDTGTEEYAQAMVIFPNNYNLGTITARFYWTAASGSGGVAWGLRGRAYGDDDALDQAQGTGQVVTDTLITANDMHVTSATSAITLAGTPAANKPVQFEIYREVGNASDTLGVDARLLGVEILYTAS